MGLDLTIVPARFGHNSLGGWFLAHDRLSVPRDYRIYGQISASLGCGEVVKQVCHPLPLPADCRFDWYEDEGVKQRTTDPYGDKLTWVTAGELAKVKLPKDADPYANAIFAMVRSLEPATPIVLWWH